MQPSPTVSPACASDGILHTLRPDGLAVVVLCNPSKLNAMTRAMWRALRSTFEALQRDAAVRCVLVRGEGGHFCAGGDISEYPEFRFDPASLRAFHEEDVWGGLNAMLQCDVPIVAQIAGNCMGAGVEIACCADLRIAAAGARFAAPIARLGFPMAPREAALVAQEAGRTTARQMLLEGTALTASDMLSRGFLTRVVVDADLSAQAEASAARVLQLAPQAARLNKQTLRALGAAGEGGPNPYGYAASAEHREGVEAFLAKRQPDFKNSESM